MMSYAHSNSLVMSGYSAHYIHKCEERLYETTSNDNTSELRYTLRHEQAKTNKLTVAIAQAITNKQASLDHHPTHFRNLHHSKEAD